MSVHKIQREDAIYFTLSKKKKNEFLMGVNHEPRILEKNIV